MLASAESAAHKDGGRITLLDEGDESEGMIGVAMMRNGVLQDGGGITSSEKTENQKIILIARKVMYAHRWGKISLSVRKGGGLEGDFGWVLSPCCAMH